MTSYKKVQSSNVDNFFFFFLQVTEYDHLVPIQCKTLQTVDLINFTSKRSRRLCLLIRTRFFIFYKSGKSFSFFNLKLKIVCFFLIFKLINVFLHVYKSMPNIFFNYLSILNPSRCLWI